MRHKVILSNTAAARRTRRPARSYAAALRATFGLILLGAATGVSATTVAVPEEISSGTGQWFIGPASDADCHFQDIQDAVDATIANDGGFETILIRVAGSEALHLGNTYGIDMADFDNVNTLTIIGGHTSCQGTPDGDSKTTLNADGNDRVFDLRYAVSGGPTRTLNLRNLVVTGGHPASGAGGGIRIEGNPQLQHVVLSNVDISSNTTSGQGSGGALSMEATHSSDSPTNWVSASSGLIINNSAGGAGGAIACFNPTGGPNPPVTLFELTVVSNEAVFDGGAIAINGCQNFNVRGESTGVFLERSIGLNSAGGRGGGFYVTGGGQLLFRASGITHSALLSSNSADFGGGLYVEGSGSSATIVNTRIVDNLAREEGGGIYATDSAEVLVDRVSGGGSVFPGRCHDSGLNPRCSRVEGNHANGHGGALRVLDNAEIVLNQTFIHDNTSDGLGSVAMQSNVGVIRMEGAVIYGNSGSSRLFQIENGSQLRLTWSTIAGNHDPDHSVQMFRLLENQGAPVLMQVYSSILWEPTATQMINTAGNTDAVADCVISHLSEAATGFNSLSFYSQVDPLLVDAENGDLRLALNSPAIDYCDDFHAPQHNDMFHNNRGVSYNLPTEPAPESVPNGVFDIGAHEQQNVSDQLFRDRFED